MEEKTETDNPPVNIDYGYGVYTGQVLNGKRNGKGIMIYPDDRKYDGEWLNNKRHGFATEHYSNGDFRDISQTYQKFSFFSFNELIWISIII